MKYKILSFFTVLFVSLSLSAQKTKKTTIELKIGLPTLQAGVFRKLNDKSMVGAEIMTMGVSQYLFSWSSGGMSIIPPILKMSPAFRYYTSGHSLPNGKNYRGSWVVSGEADVIFLVSGNFSGDDLGFYLTPGLGYEFNYKNFFVQPTVKLNIPLKQIYNQDSYLDDLREVSIINSLQTTLSIGYRF